jgi:hypothetical protein
MRKHSSALLVHADKAYRLGDREFPWNDISNNQGEISKVALTKGIEDCIANELRKILTYKRKKAKKYRWNVSPPFAVCSLNKA